MTDYSESSDGPLGETVWDGPFEAGAYERTIAGDKAKARRRSKNRKDPLDDDSSDVIWLSEVVEEALTWTWRGYLPDGKIVVLDGDPGLGKSVLWVDLVARISRGGYLPNGQPLVDGPGTCLIVSAEDDLRDTIKPRLRAAGADMKRVATLSLRVDEEGRPIPFSVPDDMDRLISAMAETGATFVVIDPVMAFVSESIQSHNDASIRRALTPLAQLAQETRAVIMLVRHLNKDTRQSSALHRGGGSIGISGAARTVLLLAPDPNESGDLVLAVVKGNLSRGRAPSISLRVEPWAEDDDLPRIHWIGHTDLKANDLLTVTDARRSSPERDEAEAFLWEVLDKGPRPMREVKDEAGQAGITPATLKKAALNIGVKKSRIRDEAGRTTAWQWELP